MYIPGELALMYNCPRAATVKCTASGVLWALDRATFRAILCSKQARCSPRTAARSPRPRHAPRAAHGSLSRAAHLCAGQASDEIYISHTCMHCISIPQASEDRELATFLGSVELLSSLTQAQLGRLSGVVTTLKFNGGEYVVRQGEVADSVF